MESKNNTVETERQGDTGSSYPCIACLEPIRAGARICPHCGSSQVASKWKTLGNILKWVGGITAIISLIAATVRINELYIGWHEKRIVVEELVSASQLQLETSDYSNAWKFLDQALSLDPASRIARQEQINLAMVWLRNFNFNNKNVIDTIEKLMTVLYRGAASEDPSKAAKISAHLGWADMMRFNRGVKVKDIDSHFNRSLKLDPDNLYGNVMYASWLLEPGKYKGMHTRNIAERLELAAHHFQKGLDLKIRQEYVRNLQIAAYLYSENLEAKVKAYETALIILNEGETFRQSYRSSITRDLIEIITSKDEKGTSFSDKHYNKLLEKFGPDQLLKIFHWAYPPEKVNSETGWLYVRARLTEESGDQELALELYRELISKWPDRVYWHSKNARERVRQIEQKMNICYVPMLVVNHTNNSPQAVLKALKEDDVLLSYDGEYIHNRNELINAEKRVESNKDVRVVFMRDATPFDLNVKSGYLGIKFYEIQVSEKALGEYANIVCGK